MPTTPTAEPRKFEAVIFDLDGTLLDTIEDIASAMNRILQSRGWPTFGIPEYKKLVGDGLEELVRRALTPHGLGDDEIAALIRDYRDEYARSWRDTSRPYPGIPELLRELARRGLKTAVLSNKSDPFTQDMTAELLPGCRFDVVRGAVPGIPLKPDPAPAVMIAAQLAVAPDACLLLGDTKVDMQTARAAGMFPVGALWGFRDAAELASNGAAALIGAPLELLPLLGSDQVNLNYL
jgi:phosphoglycolate phosphatase